MGNDCQRVLHFKVLHQALEVVATAETSRRVLTHNLSVAMHIYQT